MASKIADDLSEQLVDLQTRFAFQEDAVTALGQVVAEQQREIAQLQRLCQQLRQQGEELQGRLDGQNEDSPPPHY